MLGNPLKKFPLYSTSGYSWSSNIYKLCQRGGGGWVCVCSIHEAFRAACQSLPVLLNQPNEKCCEYWWWPWAFGAFFSCPISPSISEVALSLYDYACSYFIFITQIPYSCSSVFYFDPTLQLTSASLSGHSFLSLSHVLFLILFCFHSRCFVLSASLSFWHIQPSCF